MHDSLETVTSLPTHHTSLPLSLILPALLLLALLLLPALYNLTLHPLHHYPGPSLWAATRLAYACSDITGTVHHKIARFHARYGPVIRISPDELSYTDQDAWGTIYGSRPGKQEMYKARQLPRLKTGARSMVTIRDTEMHRRQRGVVMWGFSEEALRGQEGFIVRWADLLVRRLGEWCAQSGDGGGEGKGSVDVVPWFNWCTFDIIGDVAFGEPFGCLQQSDNHPWVSSVFQMLKFLPIFQAINYYGLAPLVKYVAPKKRMQGWHNVQDVARKTLDKRIARGDVEGRKDFTFFMRQERKGHSLTDAEMASEAVTLVVAGSETSATTMAGTVYFLLLNPEVYQAVTREVRDAFSDFNEITMANTLKLRYLQAVIQETMRIYPPAVVTFPRTVPEPGEEVCGQWVPPGTAVGVHHLSAGRSPTNWARPMEFLPERWLDYQDEKSEFHSDKRGSSQPFSFGPRNCIGKTMAWAEMRIVMAKLLWSFDMELDEKSRGWEDQKVFLVWEKKPLFVKLRPVKR